jgi:hypothetical protein
MKLDRLMGKKMPGIQRCFLKRLQGMFKEQLLGYVSLRKFNDKILQLYSSILSIGFAFLICVIMVAFNRRFCILTPYPR